MPGRVTAPPCDTSSLMIAVIASSASEAVFLSEPIFSASAETSCVLVIGLFAIVTHLLALIPFWIGGGPSNKQEFLGVAQPPAAGCGSKRRDGVRAAPQRKAVSSKLRNLRLWMRANGMSRRRSIARIPISRWRATCVR